MRNLKNVSRFFVVFAAILIFCFCKKKDENTVTTPDIFHEWTIDSITTIYYEDETPTSHGSQSNFPHTIEFKTDYTVRYNVNSNISTFPFKYIPDNYVEMDIDQDSKPEKYLLKKEMSSKLMMERLVQDEMIGQHRYRQFEFYHMQK